MFESYVIKMAEIISAIFFVKVYNIYKGDFTMAKIAICRYGSRGQGPENDPAKTYTYVVNDNVKTGDNIQVISTSSKGNKFPTTAKTLTRKDAEELSQKSGETVVSGVVNENSAKGKKLLSETQSAIEKKQGINLNETPYEELSTEQKRKIEITKSYSGKELGVSVPKQSKAYREQTRAGNISQYMQSHPDAKLTKHAQETFDSYSKPFMKGEQQ